MESSLENPVGQPPVVDGAVKEEDSKVPLEITDLSAIPGLGSATPSAPILPQKAEGNMPHQLALTNIGLHASS